VGKHKWRVTDHLSVFSKARTAHRKNADLRAEVEAQGLLTQDGPDALSAPTKRAFKREVEHHTSGWLTALPSRDHGLALTANEFKDGLALRYGWQPVNVSRRCTGCNKPRTIAHAQSCDVGPMRIQRHDYLKQLLANCLKQATTTNSVHME
jgi:hypothetical protein